MTGNQRLSHDLGRTLRALKQPALIMTHHPRSCGYSSHTSGPWMNLILRGRFPYSIIKVPKGHSDCQGALQRAPIGPIRLRGRLRM